jgi:hypothetical protein
MNCENDEKTVEMIKKYKPKELDFQSFVDRKRWVRPTLRFWITNRLARVGMYVSRPTAKRCTWRIEIAQVLGGHQLPPLSGRRAKRLSAAKLVRDGVKGWQNEVCT